MTLDTALSMKTLKAVLANILITLLIKVIGFGIFIFFIAIPFVPTKRTTISFFNSCRKIFSFQLYFVADRISTRSWQNIVSFCLHTQQRLHQFMCKNFLKLIVNIFLFLKVRTFVIPQHSQLIFRKSQRRFSSTT